MITSKKINLSHLLEREEYNLKLREFEKQFTYPLGNEKFYIEHGKQSDYFSFFEKLGKPNIMVLEKDDKVIGVCSAVLREINQQKYWYLCDFKIQEEHRGKKLYRLLMWKYFLPCYLQSQNAFAINMSNPENNKLFSHMEKIFKAFDMQIAPNYLYSFSGKDLIKFPTQFWDEHLIVSNNGDKDIVIKGESQKLYHVVDHAHFQNNMNQFTKVFSTQIGDNDSVMFLSPKALDLNFAEESVISSFLKSKNPLKISSAEI